MAKKKMAQGRPKKPKDQLRKERLTVYLSRNELAEIQAAIPLTDASNPRAWARSVLLRAARQTSKRTPSGHDGK